MSGVAKRVLGAHQAAGPPTPPVAGYTAWYDAGQIGGSSGLLSSWADESGNGHNLSSSGSNRPNYYAANSTNAPPLGGAFVEFPSPSTATYMQSAAFGSPLSSGTVFVVGNVIEGVCYLYDGIASGNRWAQGQAIISAGDMTTYAGSAISGYPQVVPNAWQTWTAQFNGASSRLRSNGFDRFVNSNIGSDSLTGITLGNGYSLSTTGCIVRIAEVIVYSSVLTLMQMQAVEAYLNYKWFMARPATSYDTYLLSLSPTLDWKLNEISGTTINDSSGNSHTGTYAGTVTLAQPPPPSMPSPSDFAVAFDGSSGKATTSYDPSTSGDFTFVCWFRYASTGRLEQLWGTNQSGGGSPAGCGVFVGNNGSQVEIYGYATISGGVGFKSAVVVSNDTTNGWINDGNWHMCTLLWQSSVGLSLIIDQGNGPDSSPIAGSGAWYAFTTGGAGGLTAGGAGGLVVAYPYQFNYYSGQVSQFAFWNSALTPTELSSLWEYGIGGSFDQTVAASAPCLWWKLNEQPNGYFNQPSSCNGFDSSFQGIGNSTVASANTLGTPTANDNLQGPTVPAFFGAPSVVPTQTNQMSTYNSSETGPNGPYYIENYLSSQATYGYLSDAPLSTANPFTMAVAIQGTAASGALLCIAENYSLHSSLPQMTGVALNVSGGKVGLTMGTGTNSAHTTYTQTFSTTTVDDGHPHFVVLVFNPSGADWYADLWCDGTQVLSAVACLGSGTKLFAGMCTNYDNVTNAHLLPSIVGCWQGDIGHTLLWDTALSSGEIATLTSAGGF
jgi:hypothetical protein